MGYVVARTIDEALAAVAGGAQVIAGGTDWFPARGDHVGDVSLVDVMGLPGWGDITATDAGWTIGAGVTWADIIRTELPPCFDALKAAAREVGSVQIQNAGTVVGNLCNASPAADGVPPLLALDAEVGVVSGKGSRRMPLADFITGPRKTALAAGEIVSAIHIPVQTADARSVFVKAGARRYLVISIAMVAVQAVVRDGRFEDLRIAVGSCGPVARRLTALEAKLEGGRQTHVSPGDLVELSPIDDVRGSADYRREIVSEMVSRMLKGLV